MAGDKTLKLSIWIAGKMDNSLTAAINSANGQISSLSRTLSKVGTVGLAAMGALAAGTVAALGSCVKEAESFEKSMGDVVKYVDGLADATGKISKNIWSAAEGGNGKTFEQNYKEMSDALLDLSTQIPMTAEQLTELAAAAGQSGKSINDLIQYDESGKITGFLKDVAMVGTAMDITADQAGNWAAKWEKSLNMTHDEVMVLFDQINYLGANSATTAAEIAEVVNGAASLGQIAGMDAASTAALADAMLAMGVDSSVASTSISRMLVNMEKGSSATKKQQEAWQSLGLTAEGVAKSMQEDATGTMLDVLERIGNMDTDKQVAALNTLFGQWAIKGAAKLTGNLQTYEDALRMVSDPALYGGSMEREFNIIASTSDAINTMMQNSVQALKIDFGTAFLPAKKELSLAMIDLMNNMRKNAPELSKLAQSAAQLLSKGVQKVSGALETAMPHIQQALDYMLNNGDKVIKIIEGIAAAFLGMKFAPQIEGLIKGAGTLLTGKGGMGSLLAGGAGAESGRKMGGLLGGIKNLFTGGQNTAKKVGGLLSGLAGATKSNGLFTTLKAAASSLFSGNGIKGTAGLLQTAAGTPGMLSGYQGIGSILAGTRAGQYLSGVGSSIGNLGRTIGGGLKPLGGMIAKSKSGQFVGGLLGKAGNFLNTATLPIRKGIAGVGASAIINGNILKQNVSGLLGKGAGLLSGVANSGAGKAIGGLLSGGAGVLGNIWGPIASGFGSLLTGAVPVVGAISGIIAVVSILGDHLEDIRGIIGNVFGEKGLAIFDAFTGKLKGIGDFITDLFQDGGVANALAPLREGFANMLGEGGFLSTLFGGQENGLAAFDGAVTILQSIMGIVGQIVTFANETVKPIIQKIFTFITGTVIPTIVQMFAESAPSIAGILSGIGSAVMTAMQVIGQAIQVAMPIIERIIEIILNIGSVAIPAIMAAVDVFAQGIKSLMESIKGIFEGLVNFITGVFTGNWQQAWEGIKQIFGNAFDALVTLCKTPINAVISLINSAISGINNLGLTIPEWVPIFGGKSFSINIPSIPMLAEGGFTNGVSIAGEKATEAVISFQRNVRENNIGTWIRAGQMLGVNGKQAALAAVDTSFGRNTVELKSIDITGTGNPRPALAGGPPIQVTYAPVYQFHGEATTKEDLVEASRISQEEFNEFIAKWFKDHGRKDF